MNNAAIDLLMDGFVLKEYDDSMRLLTLNPQPGETRPTTVTLMLSGNTVVANKEWRSHDSLRRISTIIGNRKDLRLFRKTLSHLS